MLKTLFGQLSPAGDRGRLSILIFHRVLARPDPLFPGEVDAARFERICAWLKAWFNVLPLDEATRRLADRTLPERAAAITFDDGYADNHDVALPILKRYGLVATFFITCGFLDGGRMWNDTVIEAVRRTSQATLSTDRLPLPAPPLGDLPTDSLADRRATIATIIERVKYLAVDERLAVVDAVAAASGAVLPNDLMMTAEQVRALYEAGMQIGAHTMTHPILAKLDDGAARDEMWRSRLRLEGILDAPVTLFAYPNGRPGTDFTKRTVELARELGFAAAVTTGPGAAHAASDRHELPRFTPWDAHRARFGARLLNNLWRSAP